MECRRLKADQVGSCNFCNRCEDMVTCVQGQGPMAVVVRFCDSCLAELKKRGRLP